MISVFSPFTMNHLTLRNRLVRSATWEGIARADGSLPEEAYEIYDGLAAGGIGMIMSGFTRVASNDHSFGGMMRLSDDHLIPQYKQLTDTFS